MSITYLNRLLVIGTPGRVKSFRDTMRRTLHRTVEKESWQEEVPFSLETLARVTGMRDPESYAAEPYSMSVWPIRRLTPQRAELRYQFETRNLEMEKPLKRLSRHMPALTFRLMIHCLDDDNPYSFEMKAGRARKRSFRDAVRQTYWEAARRKFHLPGDEVYDDDDAEFFAHERMREDVLNVWETARAGRRRREWWNRPTIRLMEDEMYLALAEIGEAMAEESPTEPSLGSRRAARHPRARRL